MWGLQMAIRALCDAPTIKNWRRITYYNVACAFDIETSSFYVDGEKRACMYIWMVDLNGAFIYGRTWDEFIDLLNGISDFLGLCYERRLVIYVHNLAYEMQWIRKRFKWAQIFALKEREPVYAVTESGIEFRCSYILSGYSLERLSSQLTEHTTEKLAGGLNYRLTRNAKTKLCGIEMLYCIDDVKTVTAYIEERIDKDGDISRIPLTKTGYVRQFCKRKCLGTSKHRNNKYFHLIGNLKLDAAEYEQLHRAFQGGFTHANSWITGYVIPNVASYDFTSSYPAVMVAEKFPMSPAEKITVRTKDELLENIELYNCVFDVYFEGLEAVKPYEHYISSSRCWGIVNAQLDNGRIVRADKLYTSITDIDYKIIAEYYKWDKMSIGEFRRYMRGYLPTEFITAVLDLYEMKTTLKGVKGREYDYLRGKEMVNATYGMTVTNPCRDEITYIDNEWGSTDADVEKAIEKYNSARKRFLYYPWGVWVTAYARRNLFTGISECKGDYLYSDTDSIKLTNLPDHQAYFDGYNEWIIDRLERAMHYHKLDISRIQPKTKDGIEKPLGVWDYEGTYTFKTLGAKRYLLQDDKGRYHMTVAGVAKKAVEYIEQKDNPFGAFANGLVVPSKYSGKLTHTYIDDEMQGVVKDYQGNVCEYHELSSVHLEPAKYELSLAREYADYLKGIHSITM